jgi:NAD-dependent histone deacetylase SIR2
MSREQVDDQFEISTTNLVHRLQLRDKLPNHNTVEDAVRLIRDSRRILILTGAGVSVSCGIPDFRSRDGLYASLKQRSEYDLDDPQQM